jgi:hypothetical protein
MDYINTEKGLEIISPAKHCLDNVSFEKVDLPSKTAQEVRYKVRVEANKLLEIYIDTEKFSQSDKIFMEALCLLNNKNDITQAQDITPREVDYYLRDVNSVPSFTIELTNSHDVLLLFKEMITQNSIAFIYDVENMGPFADLVLVQKIKLLTECLAYYNGSVFNQYNIDVKLIDVDDLLIVIRISNREFRAEILDELHLMLIEVFQDDNINVINEV